MSKGRFKPYCLLMALTLGAPFIAKSASIVVNGVCEPTAGSCPTVDSLSNGQETSGNFNFGVTVNGDNYNVTGSYSASYSTDDGSEISVSPVVTYEGLTPITQNDVITFDMFQNFYDTTCCTWAGEYTESIPLSVNAPGSTAEAQLFYDNIGLGLVGPFGPGSYFVTQSANLDFLYDLDTAYTLYADYDFVFDFAPGTTEGAYEDSVIPPTPEPLMTIPCGLGLILFTCGVRRRNRSRVEED